MKTVNTNTIATLDDIIFVGRNQAYGAYLLRKLYSNHLFKAAAIASSVFSLVMVSPLVYAHFANKSTMVEYNIPHDVIKIEKDPTLPKEEVVIPKTKVQPRMNTERFVTPIVKKDKDVLDEDLPPTNKELENSYASNQTNHTSTNDEDIILDGTDDEGKGLVSEAKPETIFTIVEIMPEFKGGMKGLIEYLQKNLKYPRAAQNTDTQGKVTVTFVIDQNGDISNISVLKGIGFGCDEEATRVIEKMPQWKPGIQGGKKVSVKYTLPIWFKLEKN